MLKLILIIMLAVLPAICSAAMRCPRAIIDTGELSYNVEKACGPPKQKMQYMQSNRIFNPYTRSMSTVTTQIDRWIYQKSPNEFQYQLEFENGVLKKITVSRGHRP